MRLDNVSDTVQSEKTSYPTNGMNKRGPYLS